MFSETEFSEHLILPATTVWCTPIKGAYQIGVKFAALDAQTVPISTCSSSFSTGAKSPTDERRGVDMSPANPQARAPRFNVRLSAELKVDQLRLTGTTRNLSTGGVCVEMDRPIAEGKLIRMTLFVVEDDVETEGRAGSI